MSKTKLDNALVAVTKPVALKGSVVLGEGYRITVLTSRLFRVESSKTNSFIDDATQEVWFRNLETPQYTLADEGDKLLVKTADVTLIFLSRRRRRQG
jgi:hypothetical protein